MSSRIKNRKIRIAEGTSNLGRVKNTSITWGRLWDMFRHPTRTAETFREFMALPKSEQDRLKNVDGYWIGAPCRDGRRSNEGVLERDVITFDCDKVSPKRLRKIIDGDIDAVDWEFILHSTRKHENEAPRVRIAVLCDEAIPKDLYGPVARILAAEFDPTMNSVDDVSFRPAQMMFKPTCSKNSDYVCHRNPAKPLDWRHLLDEFEDRVGDWRDYRNLPFSKEQGQKRPAIERAQDPTEKQGTIGAFCRAFDVFETIAQFLPEIYSEAEGPSGDPRYTYLEGTTTSGAIVYDGKFLYSHHGSDPAADRLCNAFDLVRIHKFGGLDRDVKNVDDADPTSLPSYKAMIEFARKQPEVTKELVQDRYDTQAMFEDISDEARRDKPEKKSTKKVDDMLGAPLPLGKTRPKTYDVNKDWMTEELDLKEDGGIKATLHNVAAIIRNDFRFNNCIGRNEFTGQICYVANIASKSRGVPSLLCKDPWNGIRWDDLCDSTIRAIIEAPNGRGKTGYGLKVSERDLREAIILAAANNKYHPFREMLDRLEWDGTRRLDTMLIRHVGAPDTAYHREISYKAMVAHVTRIYEPGHKFDFAIILQGKQGIGKSTWIRMLAYNKYFGELQGDIRNHQAMVEQMLGKAAMELPEMASFRKAESDDMKGWMSRVVDEVRLAYDRRISEFPRQCVFWGSTNDDAYLKDPTGNRRWWPCHCNNKNIRMGAIRDERDQLWAEAVHEYRELRKQRPQSEGDLDLSLARDVIDEAVTLQETARIESAEEGTAGLIRDWLDQPVGVSILEGGEDHDFEEEDLGVRVEVCLAQIAVECLGVSKEKYSGSQQMAQAITKALRHVDGWEKTGKVVTFPGYGRQRTYVRADATQGERGAGYRRLKAKTRRTLL